MRVGGFPGWFGGLARLSAETGKTLDGLRRVERMVKVNPNHAQTHFIRGAVLRIAGLLDEAWGSAQLALSLDPGNPNFRSIGYTCFYDGHLGHQFGALMAGWRGDKEKGLALAREWEAPGHYDCEWWYNLANTYAVLDDEESCRRTLERSVKGGFLCYDYMANDPLLAPMRERPAIARLVELARSGHEAVKKEYEVQRSQR